MKFKVKYLFIIFLAFFFLSSCKKEYEDGPLISFHSKRNRLQRKWEVEYISVGGVDSTYYLSQFTDSGYRLKYFDFTSNNKDISGSHNSKPHIENSKFEEVTDAEGYYQVVDKKDLRFLAFNSYYVKKYGFKKIGPFFSDLILKYRITKLTTSQLWFEIDYNGVNSKVHLKSI
jgi:hypothetical protein